MSRDALRDAVDVKAGFDLITRFADTIGATPGSACGLSREQVLAHGARFYEEGYGRKRSLVGRLAAAARSLASRLRG